MCSPASFVLTKNSVFWSMKNDSHEETITEHKLHQDGVRGPNILRVEIRPPNGDFNRDSSEWEYKLDQDLMPAWHDAETDEARARLALNDWIAARVIRDAAKRECRDGKFFVCGNSQVDAYENSKVTAYENSEAQEAAAGESELENRLTDR